MLLGIACLLPAAQLWPQSIVPSADCCNRIFSTGRWLGWGAALLEYTRGRTRPAPEDEIIYRCLREAGVNAQGAYESCSSLIPAWQNWRQKQSSLQQQTARMQSITDHKNKRSQVYGSINNTYGTWSDELSRQFFDGQYLEQVTCATCYFKLGFDMAYATQAYHQAEEALNFNRASQAQQQMNLAVAHLKRALNVLSAYQAIQRRSSFQIRCSDIGILNLEKRINDIAKRAVSPNTLAVNLTETSRISDEIGQVLLSDCVTSAVPPREPGPLPETTPNPRDRPPGTDCTCEDWNYDGKFGVVLKGKILKSNIGPYEVCMHYAATLSQCRAEDLRPDRPPGTDCTCEDWNNDGKFGVVLKGKILKSNIGPYEVCMRYAATLSQCQ